MKRILFLALAILAASPVWAGYVGANGLSGFSSVNSFTASRTLAASTNQVAVVIQSHTSGWTCPGMTLGSSDTTNGDDYLFYNLNPGTTSFSSSCSTGGGATNTTYDVVEFSGYTLYDSGSGCASGSGAPASVTITLATTGEFVIAAISDGGGSSLSSPLTQISSQSYVVDGYGTPAGSGSTTYDASVSSGWNMCADAFKTGGGSPAAPSALNTMGGIGD